LAQEYSVQTCRQLAEAFGRCNVLRPMRVRCYDAGQELSYEVTGVWPARTGRVSLLVEKFIGGGFAGQVYRVKVTAVDAPDGPIAGLHVGAACAMKILVPPTRGKLRFRNLLYGAGFQGAFSAQVNAAAARAGALWHKVIRRAAAARFGDERAVKDIYATFADRTIGSFGELSEWVDGRNWRFEVDDHLSADSWWHRLWRRVAPGTGGQPEYRAKRRFMADFVRMLHEMGAAELARQYTWWTCKSQPNVFKRTDTEGDPAAGLTAMDFRAGLALLPVLPMSPADVKLIFAGLARGSLVQFDRGNMRKLDRFIEANADHFADMADAVAELKQTDRAYRESLPDITHHHVRLFYSGRLWRGILDGAIEGWRIRDIVDARTEERMRRSRLRTVLFALLGLIPLLGTFARRLWGRADLRRHYGRVLRSLSYFGRAVRARNAEKLIGWHRAGRVSDARALRLAERPWRFLLHVPLSILPAKLHRCLTDAAYFRQSLSYVFVRPVRLYFNAAAREQWLRDMMAEGLKSGMLTDEDAKVIDSQISEPFIQKYLKALAVHVCTLPITQLISVSVAIWYKEANHLTLAEAWKQMLLIIGAFQVVPISPGSLARGLYVVYLAIRDRNVRDYNIALILGFFKYVGYLAFPIQMAYRYPALSRFMAGHWATGAARIVPVFGERGALLEHGAFNTFYNRPLTIRRRMRLRAERRAPLPRRSWHVAPIAAFGIGAMAAANAVCLNVWGALPTLRNIWWMVILLPLAIGAAVTTWAGGHALVRRVLLALYAGVAAAVGSTLVRVALAWTLASWRPQGWSQVEPFTRELGWGAFLLALLSVVGALLTEIHLPEPKSS